MSWRTRKRQHISPLDPTQSIPCPLSSTPSSRKCTSSHIKNHQTRLGTTKDQTQINSDHNIVKEYLQSNIIVKEHRTRERITKIKSRNRNRLKPLNKHTSSLMSWRTETNDKSSPLKLIQLIYCPLSKAPDVEERIPQYQETSKQKDQLEPL